MKYRNSIVGKFIDSAALNFENPRRSSGVPRLANSVRYCSVGPTNADTHAYTFLLPCAYNGNAYFARAGCIYTIGKSA